MDSPFLESEDLPLTRVVGGNVSLSKLIVELDGMYPDEFPDYTLSEKEIAFRAGSIEVIRFLKSKRDS